MLTAAKETGITSEIAKAENDAENAYRDAETATKAADAAKVAKAELDATAAADAEAARVKEEKVEAAKTAFKTMAGKYASGKFGSYKKWNESDFKDNNSGYNKGELTYLRDAIQSKIDNYSRKEMISKGRLNKHVNWLNELIADAPAGNVGDE